MFLKGFLKLCFLYEKACMCANCICQSRIILAVRNFRENISSVRKRLHPVQQSRWVLPRWKKSGASLENSPPRTSVDLKNLPAVKDFFLAVIQCPRLQKVNPRCDFFTYPSPHELLGGSKSGPSNNGVTQHYVLAGKLWILSGDNARNITSRYEKST